MCCNKLACESDSNAIAIEMDLRVLAAIAERIETGKLPSVYSEEQAPTQVTLPSLPASKDDAE